MITDIFARRHAQAFWFPEIATEQLQPLFVQAAHLIFTDLHTALRPPEALYQRVHDRLARELGLPFLPVQGDNYAQRCLAFLAQPYSLWNDHHGDSDSFIKRRFSLLELLFGALEEHARGGAGPSAERSNRGRFSWPSGERKDAPADAGGASAAFAQAVTELNGRLRLANANLAYHSGLLQRSADALAEERLATPFWETISGRSWPAVERDMKEACDRADRLEPEAATHAIRALESAIKILSDERGCSTGSEKGAGNYIDNLQSERGGRFVRRWEADALRALFRDIRNPLSHGGGSNPPEALTAVQTTWVIEACMSWIKSLACRP
jgi:hypothetical protein